jgi:hypothetical protein
MPLLKHLFLSSKIGGTQSLKSKLKRNNSKQVSFVSATDINSQRMIILSVLMSVADTNPTNTFCGEHDI